MDCGLAKLSGRSGEEDEKTTSLVGRRPRAPGVAHPGLQA